METDVQAMMANCSMPYAGSVSRSRCCSMWIAARTASIRSAPAGAALTSATTSWKATNAPSDTRRTISTSPAASAAAASRAFTSIRTT